MQRRSKMRDYKGEIREIHDEAQKEFQIKASKLSKLDLQEQELLHYIDNTEHINAVDGAKLFKKLKEIRQYRRMLKNQMAELTSIRDSIRSISKREDKSPISINKNKYNSTINYILNSKIPEGLDAPIFK